MMIKIWVFILSFFLLTYSIGNTRTFDKNIVKVDFFEENHRFREEIDYIKSLYYEDIKSIEVAREKEGLPPMPPIFSFFTFDINNDNIQDFFVYIENNIYFCGSAGCMFTLFLKNAEGKLHKIENSWHTGGNIFISKNKTNGFYDLIFQENLIKDHPKNITWKWNGSVYECKNCKQ